MKSVVWKVRDGVRDGGGIGIGEVGRGLRKEIEKGRKVEGCGVEGRRVEEIVDRIGDGVVERMWVGEVVESVGG